MISALAAVAIAASTFAWAEPPSESQQIAQWKADRDARMEWWREARFGMFIHWGAYSTAAVCNSPLHFCNIFNQT